MRHTGELEDRFAGDTTPLIDVVFLLIIFFLCIDFRVLEAKLPAHLPHDAGLRPVQTPPRVVVPVRIVCTSPGTRVPRADASAGYRLEGHAVQWRFGPRRIADLDDLRAELARIHADTSRWQVRPDTGQRQPAPVVVQPGPGTVYADVARTVDAVVAAGFAEVRFGDGDRAAPRRR